MLLWQGQGDPRSPGSDQGGESEQDRNRVSRGGALYVCLKRPQAAVEASILDCPFPAIATEGSETESAAATRALQHHLGLLPESGWVHQLTNVRPSSRVINGPIPSAYLIFPAFVHCRYMVLGVEHSHLALIITV